MPHTMFGPNTSLINFNSFETLYTMHLVYRSMLQFYKWLTRTVSVHNFWKRVYIVEVKTIQSTSARLGYFSFSHSKCNQLQHLSGIYSSRSHLSFHSTNDNSHVWSHAVTLNTTYKQHSSQYTSTLHLRYSASTLLSSTVSEHISIHAFQEHCPIGTLASFLHSSYQKYIYAHQNQYFPDVITVSLCEKINIILRAYRLAVQTMCI